MFRKIAISAVSALVLSTGAAMAAGGATHTEDIDFSFEGPFGTYDQLQLQRGLQVYRDLGVLSREIALSSIIGADLLPARP